MIDEYNWSGKRGKKCGSTLAGRDCKRVSTCKELGELKGIDNIWMGSATVLHLKVHWHRFSFLMQARPVPNEVKVVTRLLDAEKRRRSRRRAGRI